MKNITALSVISVIAVLILTAAMFFKLRTDFLDFDTVNVAINPPQTDPRATRLDNILLPHVRMFEYADDLRHMLGKKERVIKTKRLFVDRCEVTQKQFQLFVAWQQRTQAVFRQKITAPGQPLDWTYTSNTKRHTISGKLDAAVSGVTYYDAYAYCRAAGGRLPDTEEWLAVASGTEGRMYPWGDEMKTDAWPYMDPLLNATQKCGVHKTNATPEEIYQMGDSVSEWAHNPDDPRYPTIHGGNAFNRPYTVYALSGAFRHAPTRYRSPYLGFRCVYDRPAAKTPWNTGIRIANVKKGTALIGIPEDARIPKLALNLPKEKLRLVPGLLDLTRSKDGKVRMLEVTRGEITREQYRLFLNDPLAQLAFYANENQPRGHDYRPDNWEAQLLEPLLPVTGVDWWSAYAFAKWSGGRLPTASEWMALASNRGTSVYPWGNPFVKGNTHSVETGKAKAQVAGNTPQDKTESGLLDMGGNLSEWTQSAAISSGEYAMIVKGGNYVLPGEPTARFDFTNPIPPGHRAPNLGFRLIFER